MREIKFERVEKQDVPHSTRGRPGGKPNWGYWQFANDVNRDARWKWVKVTEGPTQGRSFRKALEEWGFDLETREQGGNLFLRLRKRRAQ